MHAYLVSAASKNKNGVAKALVDPPYRKPMPSREFLDYFVRQENLLGMDRIFSAYIKAGVAKKLAKG